MFDWFWEFLFGVSQAIFEIIDGLMLCANKMCGIDPIKVNGEETDFLSYFLFSDGVTFAFAVSALLATILLVIFSVFMILRTITKEKEEGTPAQIAIKAFKHLLMFFFVPVVIVAFIYLGNAFLKAIYAALTYNSASLGSFLFSSFAEKGGMAPNIAEYFRTGEWDYTNTELVAGYMPLADYPSVFSLITGLVVLFGIGSAMFVFVDRIIAIVLLYIAAPISISSSVLDDGARFKLWRDQFLIKFLTAYGMILALNIYAMVCGLVMQPEFSFFDDPNADRIMKLLVVGGGAWSVQKAMSLVGNLVSSGAGSNELRDHSLTAGRLAGKVGGALATVTGVRAVKSILSDALSMKSRDLGSRLAGVSDHNSGKGGKSKSDDQNGTSGAVNNEKPTYGQNPDASKDAINDKDNKEKSFKTTDWGNPVGNKNNGNQNSGQPKGGNGGMVNKAITDSGKEKKPQQNNEPKEDNK